ncbi:MAG: diheme cytochrome c [Burkholderiales bacterium]|nr:diheme cytochrome c [Burkholderiales bacterium]
MSSHRGPATTLLIAALCVGAAQAARADGDAPSGRAPPPPLPRYAQECGACHLPYPPALLPAASWRRLMSRLPHHFGTDASLDAATAGELLAWLLRHAGSGAAEPPEDRITRAAWFVREHREIAAAVWQRPAVKSPSQCGACHTAADRGAFDEHRIRIPR